MSSTIQNKKLIILATKYTSALNNNCPVIDEYRVRWVEQDLHPDHIREYCKIAKNGEKKLCWSCTDYLGKYKTELYNYETGPGAVNDSLAEIRATQATINAKLDLILAHLNITPGNQP